MVLPHTSPHGELTNHFDRPTRSLRLQDFVCSQWPAAPLMHLRMAVPLAQPWALIIHSQTSSNFTTHTYWHRACINFCHPRFPAVAASSSYWIRWFHDMLTLDFSRSDFSWSHLRLPCVYVCANICKYNTLIDRLLYWCNDYRVLYVDFIRFPRCFGGRGTTSEIVCGVITHCGQVVEQQTSWTRHEETEIPKC